jgi:hypothetical protein
MWRFKDNYMINEKGRVFDVQGGHDSENRNVFNWKKHNGINQQWDIVYVDEMPAEPKKGELNTDFGFKVETPFHIVSRMPSKKYLDIIGRNIVLKTANGRNSQTWYFHQQSRTIRSKMNNESFDIRGSGR